jgi:hypothetical protein
MQHDERALVKQAYDQAKQDLAHKGRVHPAAYMLVQRNPQTSAKLANPTAIGTQPDEPFTSQAEYDEFLAVLREEAKRLDALAVAFCAEALAEVEDKGAISRRRVVMIRIEDKDGIGHLHALVEGDALSGPRLGQLVTSREEVDDPTPPLLPVHANKSRA